MGENSGAESRGIEQDSLPDDLTRLAEAEEARQRLGGTVAGPIIDVCKHFTAVITAVLVAMLAFSDKLLVGSNAGTVGGVGSPSDVFQVISGAFQVILVLISVLCFGAALCCFSLSIFFVSSPLPMRAYEEDTAKTTKIGIWFGKTVTVTSPANFGLVLMVRGLMSFVAGACFSAGALVYIAICQIIEICMG